MPSLILSGNNTTAKNLTFHRISIFKLCKFPIFLHRWEIPFINCHLLFSLSLVIFIISKCYCCHRHCHSEAKRIAVMQSLSESNEHSQFVVFSRKKIIEIYCWWKQLRQTTEIPFEHFRRLFAKLQSDAVRTPHRMPMLTDDCPRNLFFVIYVKIASNPTAPASQSLRRCDTARCETEIKS